MMHLFFGFIFSAVAAVVSYNLWAGRKIEGLKGSLRGGSALYQEGKSGRACLLVHGFIGSVTDYGRLPELLHARGWTVDVPLLPGHGRDPQELSCVKLADYFALIEERFKKLRAKHSCVVLGGFSLGGTLTLALAERLKPDGLMLFAPYLQIKQEWYYGLPVETWAGILARWVPWIYRPEAFKQLFKKDRAAEIVDYPYFPLSCIKPLSEAGRSARQASLAASLPVLILHSRKDRAVDFAATAAFARRHPGAEFAELEHSNHLIFWDHDAGIVEEKILAWLKRFE